MNPQADMHAVTVAWGDGSSKWLISQPLHQSSDPIRHCEHYGSQSSVVQECSDHLIGNGGHLSPPSFYAKSEWKEDTSGISVYRDEEGICSSFWIRVCSYYMNESIGCNLHVLT